MIFDIFYAVNSFRNYNYCWLIVLRFALVYVQGRASGKIKGGFDIYILENQGRGRRPLFFVIFSENSKTKHSFYYIL